MIENTILPEGARTLIGNVTMANTERAKSLRLHKVALDGVAMLGMASEALDLESNTLRSDLKVEAADRWGVSKGSMDNLFPAGHFLVTAVKSVEIEEIPQTYAGETLRISFAMRDGSTIEGAELIAYIKKVRKATGKAAAPAEVVRQWIQSAEGNLDTLEKLQDAYKAGVRAADAVRDPSPEIITAATTALAAVTEKTLRHESAHVLLAEVQRVLAALAVIEAEDKAAEAEKVAEAKVKAKA